MTRPNTFIQIDPDVLGGTPVFSGTRVHVRMLIHHLEAGDCVEDLLTDYPTVSQDKAVAVLKEGVDIPIAPSY